MSMLPLKISAILVWSFLALGFGFLLAGPPAAAQAPVADVTGDGRVNFTDFKLLLAAYGTSTGDEKYRAAYDIAPLSEEGGPDGVINAYDMNILATYYERL